ncbi:MAG: fumarylacetoacetate hydrolase family protein, partial [Pirellulales bacterium]
TYDRSCAVGPWIELGLSEEAARRRTISIAIRRGGGTVFSGSTSIDTMKRSFSELASWLCRSQRFPHGAALLTGTGIVPDESFTLAAGDEVEIGISDLGTLVNPVVVV